MHGVKRETISEYCLKEIETANLLQKAQLAFQQASSRKSSLQEVLNACRKVLVLQPDDLNCWHARKRALINAYISDLHCSEIFDQNAIMHLGIDARNKELEMSYLCLKKNPKSYPSWHHRQWALSALSMGGHRPVSGRSAIDVEWNNEIRLLKKLLAVDGRNFHAWKYLHWVCGQIDAKTLFDAQISSPSYPPARSGSKIFACIINECLGVNFSNYSAWHYLCRQHPNKEKILEQSRNAVFTSPFDQSAWFAYNSILKTVSHEDIKLEIELLEELRKEEPRCPYLLLTLVGASNLLHDHRYGAEYKSSLFSSLKEIDPMRVGMYAHLSAGQ